MNSLIDLSVKDFRAIHAAEIKIDGITVVSGINGCGKSTLSKLLYYALHHANQYEMLVLEEANRRLRPYADVLEQMYALLSVHRPALNNLSFSKDLPVSGMDALQTFETKAKSICDLFLKMMRQMALRSVQFERLHKIMKDTLNEDKPVPELVDLLVARITACLSDAESQALRRPYRLLKGSLYRIFNADVSKHVVLSEYGDPVVENALPNVPLLHYVKKVAYIDTPMVIGMDVSPRQPSYWQELNDLLKQPPQPGYKHILNDWISREILQGEAAYSDDLLAGGFKYKRLDGTEFDLLECATGIKSFSLLQLLLRNLFLDEKTLLIIDEPEAHLHPQWIVEYARLLVLLHKALGVKFFVASHSTDMVSALRYISEKEGVLDKVAFYVASEAAGLANRFSYEYLGQDIEQIFNSFNKSYEQLDAYVNAGK